MERYLQGMVSIVTGASRGIGRAEAKALAARGAAVVINYAKNDDSAREAVKEIEDEGGASIAVRAEVSKAEDVAAMVNKTMERFGRIDILVNNAGILGKDFGKPIIEMSEEGWDEMLAVHLKGTFLCTKYVAPHMIAQKSGRIVNTSSVHGQVGGRPGVGVYGAAKAGVIALTKTCARELSPSGIQVNAISLGYVDTDMLSGMPPQAKEDLSKRQIPLGRLCRPEEIGELVSWLVSPFCTYMTGSVVEYNGGRVEYLFN